MIEWSKKETEKREISPVEELQTVHVGTWPSRRWSVTQSSVECRLATVFPSEEQRSSLQQQQGQISRRACNLDLVWWEGPLPLESSSPKPKTCLTRREIQAHSGWGILQNTWPEQKTARLIQSKGSVRDVTAQRSQGEVRIKHHVTTDGILEEKDFRTEQTRDFSG